MNKRVVIGAGQCGMKLANEFYENYKPNSFVALSTSTEDSVGIPKSALVQVSTEGSGKKFSNGASIWQQKIDSLRNKLSTVRGDEVIYFASAGGGSGSSSVEIVSNILLSNDNKVLLVLVLPFDYENLPFKPNAIQSLSRLQDNDLYKDLSIMLFNNERLAKKYFESEMTPEGKEIKRPDLDKINEHIVSTTSIAIDLVDVYHVKNKYAPFTIDELEHQSVIFSNGFIGVDFRPKDENPASVKFDYGKISDCKNVVIAKAVRLKETDYLIEQNTGKFLDTVKKISRKAKGARVMYGVIRTDKIEDGTFIIIGNNLDITKYINKTKEKVGVNIQSYKAETEREAVLNEDELDEFDI